MTAQAVSNSLLRKSVLLAASVFVTASAASAEPLNYQLATNFMGRVLVDGEIRATWNPLVGEPVSQFLIGITDLYGQNSGTAVVDVGLPENFAGGAQGLLLSAFDAHTDFNDASVLLTDVFDELVALMPTPPPIPLVGAIVLVDIADLYLSTEGPLQSSLLSLGDPNVYHWAGVAPVRIAADLNLLLFIPGREPIQFAPATFMMSISHGALAGTFEGDPTLTRLVVGVEEATVAPETDAFTVPHVIDLGALGNITIEANRLRLVVNGRYLANNRQYGLPEPPPSASGCGIGPELVALLPVLGWLRRRRLRTG